MCFQHTTKSYHAVIATTVLKASMYDTCLSNYSEPQRYAQDTAAVKLRSLERDNWRIVSSIT
jgi:hypothetical protein